MRAWGKEFFKRMVAPMLVCIGAVFLPFACHYRVMAYENVVVVIDPGHGGDGTENETDTGARYNGVLEKEVDMITAQALYDELSQYGNLTVYLTRTEDVHMELKDRVEFAKSVNADYLISVHYNASAHHRFYGTEIFTSAYGEEYARGYSLAKTIMSWWNEDGNVSKGIKTRIGKNGDYYGLIRIGREAGIPTIILEHGYLDNDRDFERLGKRDAWEHMGKLDATAIADYFGAKKGVVQAKVDAELTVPVPTGQVDDDTTPPTDVDVSIDSFDKTTGVLTYTVSAKESDSVLMYYGMDTQTLASDEEKGFMDLKVWDAGAASMHGTFTVPEGYNGPFVVRVYNNYEKFMDSAPLTIPAELLPDEVTSYSLAPVGAESAGSTPGLAGENAEGAVGETPILTLKDGSGATWTLDNALKEAGGAGYVVDHDDRGLSGNKNYIGMIIAAVAAGTMLVAALIMAVVSMNSRKKRKKRRVNKY